MNQLLKQKIGDKWQDLTDEEIAMADGRRDEFIVTVRAKYGESADGIRRQFHEWAESHSEGGH